jgi:hypothetical protein
MWTRAEQEALERLTQAEYALEQARNELHKIMRREAGRERRRDLKSVDETDDQTADAERGDARRRPRGALARISSLAARIPRPRRSPHAGYGRPRRR